MLQHQPSTRFRPIHYLGSKLRIIDPLLRALDHMDPSKGAVCDLFAGSGTVSYAASHSRTVIAADVQRYATGICSALLCSSSASVAADEIQGMLDVDENLRRILACAEPLIRLEQRALDRARNGDLDLIASILEEGSLLHAETGQKARCAALRTAQAAVLRNMHDCGISPVCLRHFGGPFFSYEQAAALDAAAQLARSLHSRGTQLMAAVLTAASELVNTVGKQFAQPLRLRTRSGALKKHLRAKVLSDRDRDPLSSIVAAYRVYKDIPKSHRPHETFCGDYRDALAFAAGRVSVVYADPPYTRDHYSRYYHVLETLIRGDDPVVAMSNLEGGKILSRGMYRADRHQSEFCIKSKAPGAFRDLFEGTRDLGVPLVLSYSSFDAAEDAHPRVVSLRDVVDVARSVFPRVSIEEVEELSYSKLNHTKLHKGAEGTREVLILCS